MPAPTSQTQPGRNAHRVKQQSAQQLGRLLRRKRLASERRLQDVARDAGMSSSQLSKLEAGEHDPQWSTVERVLKALAPGEAMDPLTLLQQLENDLA